MSGKCCRTLVLKTLSSPPFLPFFHFIFLLNVSAVPSFLLQQPMVTRNKLIPVNSFVQVITLITAPVPRSSLSLSLIPLSLSLFLSLSFSLSLSLSLFYFSFSLYFSLHLPNTSVQIRLTPGSHHFPLSRANKISI